MGGRGKNYIWQDVREMDRGQIIKSLGQTKEFILYTPGEPLTVQADIRLAVAIDQDLSDVRGCYVSRFPVLAEESWCDFHSQIWYIDFMYCLVTFS